MAAINTNSITRLYTSGTDEYGADYGAGSSGGAPIYSPVAGKILAYQPSASSWEPGRLLIQTADGAVVGIGHITTTVAQGASVAAGQLVGAVGNNGSNSHIEVMYSPTGGLSRSDFTGYGPSPAFLTGIANLVASGGGAGVTGNPLQTLPGSGRSLVTTSASQAPSSPNCQSLSDIFSQSGVSAVIGKIPILNVAWGAATTPQKLIAYATQPCVRWRVILYTGAVVVLGMGVWLLFRKEVEGAVGTVTGAAARVAG
ncbi:MAG: M23 family metallopeptidase [Pseudonocardiaceae bacterium]